MTAQRAIALVTGPASSGKSEWAEQLAAASGLPVCYVATAQTDPDDPEWQAKIARHIQRRPATWQTRWEPYDLASIWRDANPATCWLVDSLGTWVANGLDWEEPQWEQAVADLLATLACGPGQIILVAEETGWGLVPAYPSGRQFRDRLGRLTRQVGQLASAVYLVTGGYALDLTQLGQPLPQPSVSSAPGDREKS